MAEHFTLHLPWITDFHGIILASGSILYAFEGQALVLPLENKLIRPEDMIGPRGVITIGMCIVVTVNAVFGFFGYITFGDLIKGSLTLNLEPTAMLMSVKILITLIVYVGFVLQQYVVVETIWPSINDFLIRKKSSFWMINILQYGFRVLLVFIAMVVAIAVPNLWEIIPLVGTISGMVLAFVLPAFFDTITFIPPMYYQKTQIPYLAIALRLLQNIALASLGLIGLTIGLHSNIRTILSTWFRRLEYDS